MRVELILRGHDEPTHYTVRLVDRFGAERQIGWLDPDVPQAYAIAVLSRALEGERVHYAADLTQKICQGFNAAAEELAERAARYPAQHDLEPF